MTDDEYIGEYVESPEIFPEADIPWTDFAPAMDSYAIAQAVVSALDERAQLMGDEPVSSDEENNRILSDILQGVSGIKDYLENQTVTGDSGASPSERYCIDGVGLRVVKRPVKIGDSAQLTICRPRDAYGNVSSGVPTYLHYVRSDNKVVVSLKVDTANFKVSGNDVTIIAFKLLYEADAWYIGFDTGEIVPFSLFKTETTYATESGRALWLLSEIRQDVALRPLMTTKFVDYTVTEGLLLLILLWLVVRACARMLRGGFSWLIS